MVKGVALEEDYGLGFCGGTCLEVRQRKPRLVVASDQTKLSVSPIVNVSMSAERWLLTGY